MAEMTAQEAVAVLHNNQYQKHLGNGEYDYIHPLTDAEAKALESLIERQERMIEKACEKLESGDCLFEGEPCPKNYIEVGCRGCVRRWLEEVAGK